MRLATFLILECLKILLDSKFLKVTFDPETYEKGFQETDNLQTVSDDVFDYIRLLSFITPDVPGIEQWRSRDVGPKVPRYHDLHELVFILNGKGAYEINDRIRKCRTEYDPASRKSGIEVPKRKVPRIEP